MVPDHHSGAGTRESLRFNTLVRPKAGAGSPVSNVDVLGGGVGGWEDKRAGRAPNLIVVVGGIVLWFGQ